MMTWHFEAPSPRLSAIMSGATRCLSFAPSAAAVAARRRRCPSAVAASAPVAAGRAPARVRHARTSTLVRAEPQEQVREVACGPGAVTPPSVFVAGAHSPTCGPAALHQAQPPGSPPAPESPGLKDGQGTAVVTGIVSLILGVRPPRYCLQVCVCCCFHSPARAHASRLPVRVPGADASHWRPGPVAAAAGGPGPVRLSCYDWLCIQPHTPRCQHMH